MKAIFVVLFVHAVTALIESSADTALIESSEDTPSYSTEELLEQQPLPPRFRRSPEPEPQGSFNAQWQKSFSGPERRPSYNLGYQQKLFENKYGSIMATAGAQKNPGTRWEPSAGITGQFRFRRSADPEPQGSFNAQWQKSLSGPERRPSYNLDYQHKLYENKYGSVSATAGAQKNPGMRWNTNVGIRGQFRFRRNAEEDSEEEFEEEDSS